MANHSAARTKPQAETITFTTTKAEAPIAIWREGEVDHLVGLRRTKGGYSLVVAKVQNGQFTEYAVDSAVQPLQFTALQLKSALQKLLSAIP